MNLRRQLGLIAMLAATAAGCGSDDAASDGTLTSVVDTTATDAGATVGDGGGDAGTQDSGATDSGSAGDTGGAADTAADGGSADSGDATGGDGTGGDDAIAPLGQPCDDGSKCLSGICLPTPNGKFCAEYCTSGCAKDYECVSAVFAGDVVNICAHKAPYRCSSCVSDADCTTDKVGGGKASPGKCVDIGGGGFCLQACDESAACIGEGFACAQVSSGGQACVPSGGVCPCVTGTKGHCKLSNTVGTCAGTFTCVDGKPGKCEGQPAGAEQCNKLDDDCDGEVDEQVESVGCDVNNVYGTCKGKTLCISGTLLCQGASAAPEVCNGIDDNCDGKTDEGSVDTDNDGKADCIDEDDDNDTILDTPDNCPLVANVTQTDSDGDKKGDACDPDWDGDGVGNATDNCPWLTNAAQTDQDNDKIGDLCDCDRDGDGVANTGVDALAVACPQLATMDSCPDDANPQQEDLDKDGRGDACDPDIDGDGDPNDSDCVDNDATIHHKAIEACNGHDDDCDGQLDEPGATGCQTLYADGDKDGWGTTAFQCLCKPLGVYTATKTGDCADNDKAVHPTATEVCANNKDDNCDGSVNDEGATGCTEFYFDGDTDSYGAGKAKCFCSPSGDYTAKKDGDCADKDAKVNPAQNEKCGDTIDNNCNGFIDEAGCQGCLTMYEDQDNDGFGLAGKTQCLSAPKYPYNAPVAGDCDDGDANIKPGALETCNGKDDNCDSLIDPAGTLGCHGFYPDQDHDGWGDKVAPVCLCKATTATSVNKTGDCNDADPKAAPGKVEVCDGQDNDCNGQADEGVKLTFYKDNDGDGFGAGAPILACEKPANTGYATVDGDCNDFNKTIHPGADELCNQADDDCNGLQDDGLKLVDIFADVDGDGFGGKNAKAQKHCLFEGKTPPLGYALSQDDCDDSKSTVYPGAPELCDGILNNCLQTSKDAHCPQKCEGKWPVFVGGSSGFPAIAQLDGDNSLEVIARNQGSVRAIKPDGSVMWSTAVPVSYSYPSLADMNNDATVDVVSPLHGGSVAILNGSDGKVLATIGGASAAGWYGASVFDVDGDGVPDIIPTGGGSYRLLLMNADLTVKQTITLAPTEGSFSLAPPGIFDLGGDGVPEIILATGSWGCAPKPETCNGQLYLFNLAGTILNDPTGKDAQKPWFQVAGYPKTYGGEGQWPLLADFDGDGITELMHSISGSPSYLWGKGGKPHAQSGKVSRTTFPMFAPITADWKLDTTGALRHVGGAIANIDGGDDYEYIGPGAGGLVVMKGGKIMDGYPVKLGTDPPIIGDINRDGQLDILFTSGSNNSVNCYTLGADTWSDDRMLYPGATNGLSRSHYPTNNFDPFEPNDIRNKAFDPKTTKNPLADSRAFRISSLREVYSSGGGWTHKLQAVLGDKGDIDHYVLYGGIIYVTLQPMVKDYDLYVHIFRSDGTYLATRSSTNKGTAGEAVNCHSTNLCPVGAAMFIIEVRGKDKDKDFGPWPYRIVTNWAQ